jgi:hypothetical protein
VHRLRDLSRRQALVAAAMVALVLVPFVASAARAVHVHWLPSGDDALIGLRAHDVFTADRPLVGQPSTSHLYGPEAGTAHPGPIEFYWLAVPLRLLGPAVGMIVGSLAFNLAAVLVAPWVVLRRAGPRVAAWSLVLLAGVLWSEGTAVLSDPISSNAGGMALLALGALAWAIADGDVRLLPLGAVFASWVLQQHLAIAVPAGGLVAFAVIALVARWVARRRHGTAGPSWRGWVLGAVGVVLVLWAPVLWQQLTGDDGNLSAIVHYARTSDTVPLGWLPAVRQAIRAVGLPPLLLRSDLRGDAFFNGPLSILEVVVAVASYASLVAIAVVAWGRRRSLSILAVTALVLAAAGTYNGSKVPDSVEAFRVNFYRWAFVVAWLTWIALGWAGALALRSILARRGRPVPAVLPRLAPALAVVLMLVPAVGAAATAGFDDERRDQQGFEAMREMADAAVVEARRSGADHVTLVLRGRSAVLAAGSALTLQLEADGHPTTVPEQRIAGWGRHRVLEPGDEPGDLVMVLVSGRGDVPDGPGRTIARIDMNEDLRPLVAPLEEVARSERPVPSDRAESLLAERYEPEVRDYVRGVMAAIDTEPSAVLTDQAFLGLVADGYYASPTFDPDQVAELQSALPADIVNGDDVFELRVLTEEQLAEVAPAWAGG